ncbi:DNA transposase, partial [Frankliniella fusca]
TEFGKWKIALPGLLKNSKVCSLHFWHDQVIRYNEIKLLDGSVFQSKTVPHLVQGVIPSRFLDRASGALESERGIRKGSSPKLSPRHSSPPKVIIPDYLDSYCSEEIRDDQASTHTCMTPNSGSDINEVSVSTASPPAKLCFERSYTSSSARTTYINKVSASTASPPAKLSSEHSHTSSSTTTTSKSNRSGSASTISNSGTASTICSSEQTSDTKTSQSGISTPRMQIEDYNDHAYAKEMPYTLQVLRQQYMQVALPTKTWSAVQFLDKKTAFIHTNVNFETDRAVVFNTTMTPNVLFGKIAYRDPPLIHSKKQLEQFIQKIDRLSPCIGATDLGERSETCWGYINCNPHKKTKRCLSCRVHRRKFQKGKREKVDKAAKLQKKSASYRKQSKRRSRKILSLKKKLEDCFEKFKNTSDETRETIINSLPSEQQELVRNIFMAAKCKDSKGRRYSRGFIYDCLIMRIKGHALYKKLIRDNKLPLPSEKTLNKYMKGLKAEYGFQDNIFKVMGLKGKSFDPSERHGCLLLDEMQLDALLTYRADLCKVHGFVDLGKYTPSEQREKQGDHGLVLMFQPFKGQWVQTLGAFLSSAAVPGHILRKMIVEAIVLLYNQGFTVDIVTTDGARWNRAMWKLAGVNITSSCTEHPGDKNKKLWFASDFPHLVKTMWTRVVSRKEMSLPDGVIKLSHWETVIKHNEKLGIKQCWTLKSDHLKPSNYQKMNVKMAFEVSS